jgi:hypothetical protein
VSFPFIAGDPAQVGDDKEPAWFEPAGWVFLVLILTGIEMLGISFLMARRSTRHQG